MTGNFANGNKLAIGFTWTGLDGHEPLLVASTLPKMRRSSDGPRSEPVTNFTVLHEVASDLADTIVTLRRFLDSNGFTDEPINLLGHSMGTMIVLEALDILGNQGKKIVNNVVLLNSPHIRNADDLADVFKAVTGKVVTYFSSSDTVVANMRQPGIPGKWTFAEKPGNFDEFDIAKDAPKHSDSHDKPDAIKLYKDLLWQPSKFQRALLDSESLSADCVKTVTSCWYTYGEQGTGHADAHFFK